MTQTVENPVVNPAPTTATLLQRVILPRAGDPMAVRALYVDEHTGIRPGHRARPARVPAAQGRPARGHRHHRAAAAGALPHVGGRAGAERGVVRGLLQRVRRGLLAALERPHRGAAAPAAARHRPRRRLPHQGRRLPDLRPAASCWNGAGEHTVDLELDLRPFEDGGWYWFDLTTVDGDLTLVEGGWYADEPGRGRAAVTIGMPTFNRPADCVATLTAIGEDPLVLDAVVAVILPDQGTQKVRDAAGFEQAAAVLGDKLRIVDQPNLGGSGGYARVMYEALDTECEQILYMDDDILLEPDSVLRAIAFSRYSREPMLVGGQMLSLQARSQLSTMGEVVDRHTFLWRNAPDTGRTTTSPSARCGKPAGCTAAPTSTTTPGGCA